MRLQSDPRRRQGNDLADHFEFSYRESCCSPCTYLPHDAQRPPHGRTTCCESTAAGAMCWRLLWLSSIACKRSMLDKLSIYKSRNHCTINRDRKSTRLNSSHVKISYAVFCLK